MAASQGDGDMGLFDGEPSTSSRLHTRSRKRDKPWCLLCLKSGRKSKLQLFQIGSNEAMYLCSHEACPYPISMSDDLHSSVVSRELNEIQISSQQIQRGSSDKSNPMNSFSNSMPIVVPIEAQKIPTIPKDDGTLRRTNVTGDLTEDSFLQFKLWREKKRPFRSSSLSQEDPRASGKNGEVVDRGEALMGKRVRLKSNQQIPDTETTNKSKSFNKLPLKPTRHFSTSSIRKIDKTLMEASGVKLDKKFEPFKITPQDKLPKESTPVSQDAEMSADIKMNNNEDPLAENVIEESQTKNESLPQLATQQNDDLNNIQVENNIANHFDREDHPTVQPDLMQMDPLQMRVMSPEHWHQQIHGMPMQNGHVPDSVYHTPLIPPPHYLHSYNMMQTHPQYNNLIPPPSSYPGVPPPLQSPLSPLSHVPGSYPMPPGDPSQFYYPDMYGDYADQWEDNGYSQAELELTKMLDSLDMPPEQFDPTLGMLPPGASTGPDIYALMDPNTMATSAAMTGPYERPHPALQIPINSPILPHSQPLPNSYDATSTPLYSPRDATSQVAMPSHSIPGNGHTMDNEIIPTDAVTNFNNNQESPISSYPSPHSQGESRSDSGYLSVHSPTLNTEMRAKTKSMTPQTSKLPRINEVDST